MLNILNFHQIFLQKLKTTHHVIFEYSRLTYSPEVLIFNVSEITIMVSRLLKIVEDLGLNVISGFPLLSDLFIQVLRFEKNTHYSNRSVFSKRYGPWPMVATSAPPPGNLIDSIDNLKSVICESS